MAPTPQQRALPRRSPVLFWLILLTCLPEVTLSLADLGLIGSPDWRPLIYEKAAFWAHLLRGWQPDYPGQSVFMFLSYAFLHGGPLHLASNLLALHPLGMLAIARVGERRFLWLYLAAAIGGGVGFGLLSASPYPMVGASGAIFGLAGAWNGWEWQDRRRSGQSLVPVLRAVLMLVALNVVLWIATSGLLAWQTHLGGYLTGWAFAALYPRVSRAG